jgi:hypothetical protein
MFNTPSPIKTNHPMMMNVNAYIGPNGGGPQAIKGNIQNNNRSITSNSYLKSGFEL